MRCVGKLIPIPHGKPFCVSGVGMGGVGGRGGERVLGGGGQTPAQGRGEGPTGVDFVIGCD